MPDEGQTPRPLILLPLHCLKTLCSGDGQASSGVPEHAGMDTREPHAGPCMGFSFC